MKLGQENRTRNLRNFAAGHSWKDQGQVSRMREKNEPVEMVTGTDFHLPLTLGTNCPESRMTDLLMMVLCMQLVAVSRNCLLLRRSNNLKTGQVQAMGKDLRVHRSTRQSLRRSHLRRMLRRQNRRSSSLLGLVLSHIPTGTLDRMSILTLADLQVAGQRDMKSNCSVHCCVRKNLATVKQVPKSRRTRQRTDLDRTRTLGDMLGWKMSNRRMLPLLLLSKMMRMSRNYFALEQQVPGRIAAAAAAEAGCTVLDSDRILAAAEGQVSRKHLPVDAAVAVAAVENTVAVAVEQKVNPW